MISENEAADTPIIFEEFVMVMINFAMVLCNKNFIRNVFPKQVLVQGQRFIYFLILLNLAQFCDSFVVR